MLHIFDITSNGIVFTFILYAHIRTLTHLFYSLKQKTE